MNRWPSARREAGALRRGTRRGRSGRDLDARGARWERGSACTPVDAASGEDRTVDVKG
jgi:hypothetical protein